MQGVAKRPARKAQARAVFSSALQDDGTQIAQQTWERPPEEFATKLARKEGPIEGQESYKWLWEHSHFVTSP